LSLNTATGVISGTMGNTASTTAYTFTIRGTDTDGDTVDQSYSWSITTVAPTVTGGTVTISAVDEGSSASYDVDTNFTFGTGSTFSAYSLQSGSLPSGLSLNTSTGVISGNMGEVSSTTAYSFTIRATDTDGDTADQAYSWTITNVPLSATGGTITTYSSGGVNYKVNTFTSGGTITFNKAGSVDVLIVAGGGGGGTQVGSGGGAGGFVYYKNTTINASGYTISIGNGGSRAFSTNTPGQQGGNSSFTGLTTAIGGGGGSVWSSGLNTGGGSGSGGQGGGGSASTSPGSGTTNQGNSGGSGAGQYSSGGGGGAKSAGSAGIPSGKGGAGGAGYTEGTDNVYNFQTGSSTLFSINGTGNAYAGGGGGGGTHADVGRSSGGVGGGGMGASGSTSEGSASSTAGATNTGGGGGGARDWPNGYSSGATNGSNGGSGIVIVRYAV